MGFGARCSDSGSDSDSDSDRTGAHCIAGGVPLHLTAPSCTRIALHGNPGGPAPREDGGLDRHYSKYTAAGYPSVRLALYTWVPWASWVLYRVLWTVVYQHLARRGTVLALALAWPGPAENLHRYLQ